MLKSAGILYHTPEAAAGKINSVYYDVEGWWNGSELQFAIKKFCNCYAIIVNDAFLRYCVRNALKES